MPRPRKNQYRDFLLSMTGNWTPPQIADAIEACGDHAFMQRLVLELAGKPQTSKPSPGQGSGLLGAASAKPVPLCSVCRFVPAELETIQGPMCMDCATERSTDQSGEDIKSPGKEEEKDAGRPEPETEPVR